MLGIKSVMNGREGPVFTGQKKHKGYQSPIWFDLSEYPKLGRLLDLLGFCSVMQSPYKEGGALNCVYTGPVEDGTHPKPELLWYKKKEETGTPPAPPTQPTHPGYALGRKPYAFEGSY
ncbi:MAG: hypothetical protein HY513_00545 [Candidatus Aenigmarchaeota archaeon]|nr:hypothetical protein [Candidatus Aenigmarchaeota archaeon]